jgi:hypothetical protein
MHSGLKEAMRILKKCTRIGFVHLTEEDVVRQVVKRLFWLTMQKKKTENNKYYRKNIDRKTILNSFFIKLRILWMANLQKIAFYKLG